MEITSVATTLGAISNAVNTAKSLISGYTSLEKADVQLQIADLISELADAKMETANIQQLLLEKDKNIQELKEQLSMKGLFHYEAPFYWRKIDGGERRALLSALF